MIFRSLSPNLIQGMRMLTSQRNFSVSLNRYSASVTGNCPFDICTANAHKVKLDKSLHENINEKCAKQAYRAQYLRSGMVLLENFISHIDQVKIVKTCRDLGSDLGSGYGGFYRFKSSLQMMCLGKDWDFRSSSYGDSRRVDGAVPHKIPEELKNQVDDALRAAHKFLMLNKISENEIPSMSPDICIVNFYDSCGKLGLHQDKDESIESLRKGVPVVSFSVGDSAEFLYSNRRVGGVVENVILKSGDVLIFGGKSRLIFHGVSKIIPNTTPKLLSYETNLRPGRLNLTFRQF